MHHLLFSRLDADSGAGVWRADRVAIPTSAGTVIFSGCWPSQAFRWELRAFIFKTQAETTWRSPYVIGTMLIVVGLLMWASEYVGRKQKDLGHVTPADAISIGIGQALAVVPGTSRSGITISAGLFRNLDRRAAARFSFLLSTPAIGAAAAKDFWDLYKHEGGLPADMHVPFAVGILVSAIVGCLTIKFFMDFLRRSTFTAFIIYRIIFGIIVIALANFFRFSGG